MKSEYSATQIAIAALLAALGAPPLAVIAYLVCAVLIGNVGPQA